MERQDESGQIVALVHDDPPTLRRMAVFEVQGNNADCQGDHVLAKPAGTGTW